MPDFSIYFFLFQTIGLSTVIEVKLITSIIELLWLIF